LKDQKVSEGASVTFKTKATGKPVPTAQWFKGDKIIKPSKYFQMNKERDYYTLKISEAFPEDEGTYKCVLKNSAGESTTTAKLNVLAPEVQDALPKITPLKDVIVSEGQPAKFKTTHTSKSKITVQWFREGEFKIN
jgi:titin